MYPTAPVPSVNSMIGMVGSDWKVSIALLRWLMDIVPSILTNRSPAAVNGLSRISRVVFQEEKTRL